MSQISKVLRDVENDGLSFWCTGCNSAHTIYHGNSTNARWSWNGNIDKPTFSPSVLIRSGHYIPDTITDTCWCTYNRDNPDNGNGFKCGVCHSFIIDGNIQYLDDCTHELKGQTIPLPEWPKYGS
jgi:hypothetical protein